jgi:DNA polymerase I-like protein with 3'-5' exonuclease and polymerase domains
VRAFISEARALLVEPGDCAIDFETYPTDPAWHARQAAAAAPRGMRRAAGDAARRAAQLGGRAHRRQPCVLALVHENGGEAVGRLVDPRTELPAMFDGRRASLVAHNAQFEVECLLAHGVAVECDCTLLAAKAMYLIAVDEDDDVPQPVDFGLAGLARLDLGRNRDKTIRDRDWRQAEALDAEALDYCRQDARDALALWQLYRRQLEQDDLLAGYQLIADAILPTAAINLAGLLFDCSAHSKLVGPLRADAERLAGELDAICGGAIRNHSSGAQISALIERMVLGDEDPVHFSARLRALAGVRWKRGKNGHLAITKSTKRRMSAALAEPFPVVARYLTTHAQLTKATKLLSTFGETLVQWLDEDGRLRGQLKVGGTVTLRHSASRPNVQQMPREEGFRALFKAPPGWVLIVCDFSQIELRLVAIIAPDEALLAVYREGRDVHQDVADAIGLPRGAQSKGVSFAMVYGAGVAGVAEAAGLDSERAADVVELFLRAYPGLRA